MMPRRTLLLVLLWLSVNCHPARAADSPEVAAAIERGLQYLQKQISATPAGGHRSLVALALIKGGVSAESVEIQTALKEVLNRCTPEGYSNRDGIAGIYAAGVDATLLVELDSVKYQPQLQAIGNYLQTQQSETGGWDYPGGARSGTAGDTSVTQYACLGLWAVERAGVKVDPQVWVRVLNWHTRYQSLDGGFGYTPSLTPGGSSTTSSVNMSVNAVGSLHIAMLHLSPDFQPLRQSRAKKEVPSTAKKFGVLEEVKIEERKVERAPAIPEDSIQAVRKAFSYVVNRYTPLNDETTEFKGYFLYSLERMAALADVHQLGERDWYQESSTALLTRQQPDGSWNFGADRSGRDTAFSVLFLTRSTAKVMNRVPAEQGYGDGTLAGGRGLPDDLMEARYDGRSLKGKEQQAPPLDKLLAALQTTGEINLDEVQNQLVTQVQLGDRRALIGEVQQLRKLATHSSPEVRRTAMWGIGRSERLDLGTILIQALNDPDLGVIIEARNGLCWLSRKPNGFGEVEDPLAQLPADATEQQKTDSIAGWHRSLILNWGRWYLEARPFADRGDAFEADLRRQMRELQQDPAPPAVSPQ
ncbi:hypothetical protein SH661x_004254 [Planctomicrobium sp. SH661]|uniref:hypothetical protein n=1 Tax=Planctomicrobium sp. SH661 TaxID=3448124 RepID=UPI003F5BD1B1